MSFKILGGMVIITFHINAYVYIEIYDNFLVLSIGNWFSDDKVIFQDDNASCQRTKEIKAFLQERWIKWPMNRPDLNPTEYLCEKLKKNGSREGFIHQRRSFNNRSGKLEPLALK